MNFVSNHFKRHLERGPFEFCWRVGLESFVLSCIVGIIAMMFGAPERKFPDWSLGVFFLIVVVICPSIETLLLQAFPIYIARKFKAALKTQIIIAMLVFAVLHLPDGVLAFMTAGLIGGFYFSFAYANWRLKSRRQAFWVTAGCHTVHNSIAFVLMLIFGL